MKKEPKLRFPEFSGEWEEKKLGDVKDVRDGTHDSPKYKDEGYPLVTSKNLTESGLSLDNVSLISSEDFNEINKRSKVDTGDILFGMIGTIGNPVLIDSDNFAIKNVALIKDGGYMLNPFLLQHLKSPIFERYIQNEKAGNTQKFLGLNKIRDYVLLVPSLPEQQRIAGFLSTIDSQLETKEQSIENLEEMKKGFMQRIFSQEIRFKDEKGEEYPEWEEKKLGEIGDIYQPQTITISSLNGGDYKVFGANGYVGYHDKYNHEQEQCTVSCRGENSGNVNFVDAYSWITGNSMVINLDNNRNVLKRLLFYMLSSHNLKYLVTGSGQPQIIRSDIAMHKVFIPSLPEQQKIANFFSLFDEKIEIEKEIFETLKEIKRGLLQQMFV